MTTRRNLLLGLSAIAACGAAPKVTVTRPGTAFGTTVSITVTAYDARIANQAIDAGFAEIRAVHKAASLFDPASEVSRLNNTGWLQHATNHFLEIVALSNALHHLTKGAFDPSIQPLWALWEKGRPSLTALTDALSHVGWHKLTGGAPRLELQPGTALTFNGIAQGYAADCVLQIVQKMGALSAVVDTGEIGRLNAAEVLHIQHPRLAKPIGSLKMHEGFVAVSGDYATTFTPDFAHHHIFDPRLGHSPNKLASVVVTAPTGAMADGLATAFMVMGVEQSLQCLQSIPECHALFIDKAGDVSLSVGMAGLFQKT